MVDNEYLGTLRVPAEAAGRKIDFRLNEECLLQVIVEEPTGPRRIELATRDTPELLKKELARVAEEKAQKAEQAAGTPSSHQEGSGLFSSIKSIFRRG
jgi:molecular chaperone DnaK